MRHPMSRTGLLLSIMLATAAPVDAQSDATTRILVGSAAGATTDAVARLLAEKLRTSFGSPVIVENKPGAGQRTALGELKRSAPDGRTMMMVASGAMSILPHVYGDATGYDSVKDFTPVTRIAAVPLAFGTGPKTGAKNLAEFFAWLRANPAQASFGSPGAGSGPHFVGLILSKSAGVPMAHVPYRGMAPGLTELIGGHIPAFSAALSDFEAHHRDGRLRVLGMTGSARSPRMPDVSTFREQGHDLAFEIGIDVYLPAKVPDDVVKRLNASLVEIVGMPDVRRKFDAMSIEVAPMTSQAFAERRLQELKFWEGPVKQSGFKGE